MRSLISLLVVAARPYTRTQMVTEAVSDPSERRLYGLFEVAACGSAPQTTNNSDDEGDIALHDNHCDNTTYDGVATRPSPYCVQSKTRLLPNSTALQQRSKLPASLQRLLLHNTQYVLHNTRPDIESNICNL